MTFFACPPATCHFCRIAAFLPILACTLLSARAAEPQVPANIEQRPNVEYATYGDRKMLLDLYLPKGQGPFPGVILIHGGGWTGGNKESFRALGQQLAARGYVTAAISYRLATEAPFPAAVNDCKAALRWLRSQSAALHLDPKRIGAIGGSAGGHLAGMLATTGKARLFEGDGGHADESSELQAAVLLGAGVDQVARAIKEGKPIANCVTFFGGTYAEKPEVYKAGSPITHVTADTPPILFLDGGLDMPGERYVDMQKKLVALGVANSLEIIPDAKHGNWNKQPFFEQYLEHAERFLAANLKKK